MSAALSLRELEATFLVDPEPWGFRQADVSLSEAKGVMFLCPKCYQANGGAVGTHRVICWFEGVPAHGITPGPGRWRPSGTGIDDLTFVGPGAASVGLSSSGGGCGWHGFIRGGKATLT